MKEMLIEVNKTNLFERGAIKLNNLNTKDVKKIKTFFHDKGYKRASSHKGENIGIDFPKEY